MRPFWTITILLLAASIPMTAADAGSPPSVPTGVTALTGAGTGEIVVNWTAPTSAGSSPIAGYNIYRSLSPTGLSHYVTVGNVLSFTDTSISDAAPRYYRVSALNGDGESPISSAASASAKAPPSVPLALETTRGPGRGNVTLAWQEPQYNGTADITEYRVYRFNETTPVSYIGSSTTRNYSDSSLPDSSTFSYRVSAVNVYGEGPIGSVTNGSTQGLPSPPRNVRAGSFPGTGVTITWDPPFDDGGNQTHFGPDQDRYLVYRAIGNGAMVGYVYTGWWDTSYTDFDCPILETCHYRVAFKNGIGWSPLSLTVGSAMGDALPIIG